MKDHEVKLQHVTEQSPFSAVYSLFEPSTLEGLYYLGKNQYRESRSHAAAQRLLMALGVEKHPSERPYCSVSLPRGFEKASSGAAALWLGGSLLSRGEVEKVAVIDLDLSPQLDVKSNVLMRELAENEPDFILAADVSQDQKQSIRNSAQLVQRLACAYTDNVLNVSNSNVHFVRDNHTPAIFMASYAALGATDMITLPGHQAV